MKSVAVLSCDSILKAGPGQRADAFEHDIEISHFTPAFSAIGRRLCPVSWDDPGVDWSAHEAAILRTTWDYQDRLDEFLGTLERIQRHTRVLNPPAVVRWNVDKSYLFDLQEKRIPILPTWRAKLLDRASLQYCMERFRCGDLVIKRCIGASAEGQYRYRDGDAVPLVDPASGPWLVQPYQPSITSEGELSLVFFGERCSHAIRKRPAPDDYRVQSLYGGQEQAVPIDEEAAAIAAKALAATDPGLLYARVDLMRREDGSLAVTELELIEPYLYPSHGREVGAALARRYLELVDPAHRKGHSEGI